MGDKLSGVFCNVRRLYPATASADILEAHDLYLFRFWVVEADN
jgi:hypothetical protein